ncbi:MAG: hypothetical protein LBE20_01405 [Deltaproteobacteria bacterium]|jgi:hypothetical protein|nr:hypothetical protein [Deltaproteobacteria bacterium]
MSLTTKKSLFPGKKLLQLEKGRIFFPNKPKNQPYQKHTAMKPKPATKLFFQWLQPSYANDEIEFEWKSSKICPSPLSVKMFVFNDVATGDNYQYRKKIVELVMKNPNKFFLDKETNGNTIVFPDQYYIGQGPVRVIDDFCLEIEGITHRQKELREFIPPKPVWPKTYVINFEIFESDEDPMLKQLSLR